MAVANIGIPFSIFTKSWLATRVRFILMRDIYRPLYPFDNSSFGQQISRARVSKETSSRLYVPEYDFCIHSFYSLPFPFKL